MKHLRRVTVGKAATEGPDVLAILEAIFAFVLDLLELKGTPAT